MTELKDFRPVIMNFQKPLNMHQYKYLLKSLFREDGLNIWGNPIILGPTKVHIYGVDKDFWQQIFLEITDKHIVIIAPKKAIKQIKVYFKKSLEKYLSKNQDTEW